MVLLHLLHQLAKARRWKLTAAYFNHQLRPGEDAADQRLVKKVCAQLRVSLIAGKWVRSQSNGDPLANLEMQARIARHRFLAQAAKRARCSIVAMAHHADDQIETFFLHLARGAGGAGLSGIAEQSTLVGHPQLSLVRPLLGIRKQTLLDFAATKQIAFREDSSNANDRFLRNRIRNTILPMLRKELSPAMDEHVLRAMGIIALEATCVSRAAADWLRAKRRATFSGLAPAIQRQVILQQLAQLAVPADFERVEHLRHFSGRPITVEPCRQLVRGRDGILQWVIPPEEARSEAALSFDPTADLPALQFGGWEISCRLLRRKIPLAKLAKKNGCEHFDADKLGARVTLRHWQQGDRFQPLGMPSAVKLQDLFINSKIPKAERHRLLIATTDAGEIFWVQGLRMGELAKVRPDTHRVCRWTWRTL